MPTGTLDACVGSQSSPSAVCGAIAVGSSLAANPSSLRLVRVAGGFSTPVFATQAPGEPKRLYVVEQPGRIRVVENGKVGATPFLDIRGLVSSRR